MIAANELRLGNWVSNGEKQYTVDVNMLYDIATSENFPIDPIPLTPEILEKCGFVFVYQNTFLGELKKHFIKEGFDGLADYGVPTLVLSNKGNYLQCGYNENQITCQTLHQLQNIYFALTGTELNYSPELLKPTNA